MMTLTTEDTQYRKEIIELATKVYGECDWHESALCHLEAFAKLVASEAIAKKHEELYRLAEDAPVRGDARETRQNILHAIRGEAT